LPARDRGLSEVLAGAVRSDRPVSGRPACPSIWRSDGGICAPWRPSGLTRRGSLFGNGWSAVLTMCRREADRCARQGHGAAGGLPLFGRFPCPGDVRVNFSCPRTFLPLMLWPLALTGGLSRPGSSGNFFRIRNPQFPRPWRSTSSARRAPESPGAERATALSRAAPAWSATCRPCPACLPVRARRPARRRRRRRARRPRLRCERAHPVCQAWNCVANRDRRRPNNLTGSCLGGRVPWWPNCKLCLVRSSAPRRAHPTPMSHHPPPNCFLIDGRTIAATSTVRF